jgi:PAS domain S-box-containing protein
VVDRRGFITEINTYASRVFGYAPKDIIGKNFFDYLPVASVIKGKENFIHYCRQVQSYHIMQDVGLDVGGKPVLGDLYFTTIFNIKGEFTGYNVLGWLTNNPRL